MVMNEKNDAFSVNNFTERKKVNLLFDILTPFKTRCELFGNCSPKAKETRGSATFNAFLRSKPVVCFERGKILVASEDAYWRHGIHRESSIGSYLAMSERLDNEQLKAKIGQVLYNEFITGRLKEEILSQFMQRGTIDLSYSLGKDANGDEICVNARIYRRPAQLEKFGQELGRRSRLRHGRRKYVFYIMSSEKSTIANDESLRMNFDNMLSQSLPWWDRYSTSGIINVRDWRLDKTIVSEGKSIVVALRNALKTERAGEKEKQTVVSDLI